ncbi:MAG: hypothetical protein VX672_07010 [Planctomycetota bacterium]|nr:hypothetical protein [Planctomycetota bacterium]
MNKGMPIWERHIEKLVFGLTLVVLLAVFAMLVLGTQAVTVEIDGEQYGPAETDQILSEKGQDLARRLDPRAEVDTSAFEAIPNDGAVAFMNRLTSRIGPDQAPPTIAPALASALMPEGVESFDRWYYEPRFDAPTMRAGVIQTTDTIESAELQRIPALGSRLGGDPDVVWATPVAVVDVAAMRRELQGSNTQADPPRFQIPDPWYNKRPYILDVVFERQALVDGSWGPVERVEILPGAQGSRADLESRAQSEFDAQYRQETWLRLNDRVNQLEILQPEFYPTTNSAWAISVEEPVDDEDETVSVAGLDEEEIARREKERELRRRLIDQRGSASRPAATLKDLGGPLRETEDDENDGAGRGGSGRGGSGRGGAGRGDPNGGGAGFGSGGAGRNRGRSVNESDRRRRIALTLRLDRLTAEIQRLEEQLAILNPDASAETTEIETIELPDLLSTEEILAWAHDLDVEPGGTYRYRSRVRLYNPFFARTRQLLPEQQSLVSAFFVESETSDWSAPVTIPPPVEFFIVRATDGEGSLGLGEIRVDLFRYEDGARRSESFTVQPGERVGKVVQDGGRRIDFSTDWYLVDVVADPAAKGDRVDAEDDSTVVFRRADGSELQVRVPSDDEVDPRWTRLRVDAESAAG